MSRRIRSTPRFGGGRNYLAALSEGPVAEGMGRGDLRAATWAFWVEDRTWVLHLSKLDGNPDPALDPAPSYTADLDGETLERVSLAFDQNARRVLAWQIGSDLRGETPSITLSYIETGVPEMERRVGWAGVDPALFWDGTLLEAGENTDLICFYLSPDRRRLKYRLQQDLYAVEYDYLELPEPCTITRWKIAQRECSLVLQGGEGTLYETRTDPYPIYPRDRATLLARLAGGARPQVIMVCDPYAEATRQGGRLERGSYRLQGQEFDSVFDLALLGGRLERGSYRLTNQLFDGIIEAAPQGGRLDGGSQKLVVVSSGDPKNESGGIEVRFGGGTLFERTVVRDPYAEGAAQGYRFAAGSFRDVNLAFDPLAESALMGSRLESGDYHLRVYTTLTFDPQAAAQWGRLSSGAHRQQNQLFDVVSDAGLGGLRLASGTLSQTVFEIRGADPDQGRMDVRLVSGVLAETNRIQRVSEGGRLDSRLGSGSLNLVTLIALEPLAEAALQTARLEGGLYALAPTLYPLYDLHRLFDAGQGPEAQALEFLYVHLGGY